MKLLISIFLAMLGFVLHAHENIKATYLGNEAVLVTSDHKKIIFDPLFHNNFNIYQKVPQQILEDLFANKAPYNDIDAIFISHAHGDHFAADLIYQYLTAFPKTRLFASKQAVDQIVALDADAKVTTQLNAIELAYQDPAKMIEVDGLQIDVVRIPHSGWPNSRTEVSNLLFRVTLDDVVTVIHMGDADPNDVHFYPYDGLWKSEQTDMAFPPYWFYMSTFGPGILEKGINTKDSIGVHVPVEVPAELIKTGKSYFSEPGEKRVIQHQHPESESHQ